MCGGFQLKALRRLDPNSELVPVTPEDRYTASMVLKWIRIHVPDRALDVVERSINLLKDVAKPKGAVSSKPSFTKR